MKRVLLVATVLLISVISTACINNLAVQELNTKAKEFIENGDYTSAVERLKSSIDLDSMAYESHYNLAVAYTKLEDYANAMKSYKRVIELNPDFAEVYYSLAVCEENLIVDIEAKRVILAENGELVQPSDDDEGEDLQSDKDLSLETKAYIVELVNDAIKNYEKYLTMTENASDRAAVDARIQDLKGKLSVE